MNKFSCLLGFLFFCGLVFSTHSATVDLNGDWSWRTSTHYHIIQAGDHVQVSVFGGQLGPYYGNFTSNEDLEVKFGPRCCTGKIKKGGKAIEWSNKTRWTLKTQILRKISPMKAKVLLQATHKLTQARRDLLKLREDIYHKIREVISYADKKKLRGLTEVAKIHNHLQISLGQANHSIFNIEVILKNLTLTYVYHPPNPNVTTTPAPTKPPTTPGPNPNEPAEKLRKWFHDALLLAQTEAASDLKDADGLISGMESKRKANRRKWTEEAEKAHEQEVKKREQLRQQDEEQLSKREAKRKVQKQHRAIAYEHYLKKNPTEAAAKKLDTLRDQERILRKKHRKEQREKRHEESKSKRKDEREKIQKAVDEREKKREDVWAKNFANLRKDVEGVANKTIVTLGSTIQAMQVSLHHAKDELVKIEDSCEQAKHLQVRFVQAAQLTQDMKKLATNTINALKAAKKAVAAEQQRHEERVSKRLEEQKAQLARDRIEDRLKRRETTRAHENGRKKHRREATQKRKVNRKQRDERYQKRDQEQQESKEKAQLRLKEAAQRQEKDDKRVESKLKAQDHLEQTNEMATQIKQAIQSVVDTTKEHLHQNLKELNIPVDKNCDKALQGIQKIGQNLVKRLQKRWVEGKR